MSTLPAAETALRVEKLRFLVEELALSFALSRAAPNAWSGRVLARHVLIRASDFIAHARGLRRAVRAAGDERAFNTLKETYAGWFDEYFEVARNRLGAHVQDLDFGERIELWNAIETSKIAVFVDGARQIYDHLEGYGLPGYIVYQPPAELSDLQVQAALNAFRASAKAQGGPEFASDVLALTRPNTVAVLNAHPLHARAGQLTLVLRWIDHDLSVLAHVGAFPRLARILRAQLLTDIVSFADGLISRSVPTTAPQAMKGLEALLQDEAKPSATLAALQAKYRFGTAVDRLRVIRNSFAAHLDIDASRPLSALLTVLDDLEEDEVDGVLAMLRRAFRATCAESLLLHSYLIDGVIPKGTLRLASEQAETPYDPAAPVSPAQIPASPSPPIVEARVRHYQEALARWLTGTDVQREAAGDFLRTGFSADVGEAFTLERQAGAGSRNDPQVFTVAHAVVLQALCGASKGEVIERLLQLLRAQRSGYPARAAEVLLRFAALSPRAARQLARPLCDVLGDLAVWDSPRHKNFLHRHTAARLDWPVRRAALLALFKAFVRTEGLGRINRRQAVADYDRDFAPLLAGLARHPELEVRLGMASAFLERHHSHYRAVFEHDRTTLAARLQALVEARLAQKGRHDRISIAAELLAAEDYPGLVLLLAEGDLDTLSRALLGLVRDEVVLEAVHAQAARHKAICLWRIEAYEPALDWAKYLADREPANAEYQILHLQFLVEQGRDLAFVRREVRRLRCDFVLEPAEHGALTAVEGKLAALGGRLA